MLLHATQCTSYKPCQTMRSHGEQNRGFHPFVMQWFLGYAPVSWCMPSLRTLCTLRRQMRPQRSGSGSAFVTDIEKRTIMTNSHVVRTSLAPSSWSAPDHRLLA
jgi:S1-C subfamily serine protease